MYYLCESQFMGKLLLVDIDKVQAIDLSELVDGFPGGICFHHDLAELHVFGPTFK
jgi:hypothetical protein